MPAADEPASTGTARNPVPMMPSAKRYFEADPATGSRAFAADAADETVCMPWEFKVAAVDTMIANITTCDSVMPACASSRPYCAPVVRASSSSDVLRPRRRTYSATSPINCRPSGVAWAVLRRDRRALFVASLIALPVLEFWVLSTYNVTRYYLPAAGPAVLISGALLVWLFAGDPLSVKRSS